MIYFDNNATTRVAPEVLDAMLPFLVKSFGNPSSGHAGGRAARKAVEQARASVANLLGADSSEIIFTSGGTESDNWAIMGALERDPDKRHIVTTRVEHEAVRRLCEKLERNGCDVSWLEVDEHGSLDLDQVHDSLREDTAVVSVMLANNETGVLFPVEEVAEIVKTRSGALIHVDGVNAVGKIPIDLGRGSIDMFSLSAHKFHGPKGIGAIYVRQGVLLPPLFSGGGQEGGTRPGTEAVHQIVGMGAAADLVKDLSEMDRVRTLRDKLEAGILQKFPNSSLNGTTDKSRRLPNTSNISFENVNGEAIVALMDQAEICVSTGSACNSADHAPSAVLQAMNVPYKRAMGSVRFSLGRYNTDDEVETTLKVMSEILSQLSSFSA